MHISKLPTELDINIARFIVTKHHVSALSQISKFYRNDVAEPLLYGTFVFDVRDRRTNYQFLLALLQRPELALHINSMRINTHRETLGSLGFVLFKESTTDQKKQIWFLNSVISKLISSIMCTELETDESIELQNRLLGGLYMHEVSDNRDETVLALILCMATNVEALEVCSQHYCLRTIGLVLQFPWTNTDTQPLSRLKHMHQCCCTGLPGILDLLVYPAMQTARVCNGKAWRTPWLGLIKSVSMPKIPKLLTLEFIKVAVDPLRISEMIMLEASSVANLNTLLVQDCDKPQSGGSLRIRNQDNDDDVDDEEGQAWNMPNLVKTLSEHVFKLESFTWSHQSFLDSRTVPFGDFTAMSSLKTLTLDDKFLSLDAKANLFTKPEAYFLSTLQELSIVEVSLDRLHQMVEMPSNCNTAQENKITGSCRAINAVTTKLPLKALEISIVMELKNADEQDGVQILELDPDTGAALRHAADELYKAGFTLKVYRCPGLYDEGDFQLLISAGFTDPVPNAVRRELRELDEEEDRMTTLSI